jgi:hypothetical protein
MALIPIKQIDFGDGGISLGTGSLAISGGLLVSGGIVDFTNASDILGTFGIFAQTGSFYATTNDLQVTGSFIVSGSQTITGAITHDQGNGSIQFVYYDANNQQQYIVPITDGQLLMFSGSAITASNWIDGGTY